MKSKYVLKAFQKSTKRKIREIDTCLRWIVEILDQNKILVQS